MLTTHAQPPRRVQDTVFIPIEDKSSPPSLPLSVSPKDCNYNCNCDCDCDCNCDCDFDYDYVYDYYYYNCKL